MIIVKSDTIYVPKNYNVTGTLQLVVKDRATDEEIVFDNPGDNNPGLQVGSYHILTIDAGRLEPSTEYEYTLIAKDVEKIIGRGLLRTE